MKAKVRTIFSPDLNLEDATPPDREDVGIAIQLLVGPADQPGEEAFDLVVCTPQWLGRRAREYGPIVGRHYLIVAEFESTTVVSFLTKAVESLEGEDWEDLAGKISRIGRWEFEDYRAQS